PAAHNVHDTIVDGAHVIDGMPLFDASKLFVTPATVAAIAKAKQRPTQPTIKVDFDAKGLTELERERLRSHELDRAERADAFAKLRGHIPLERPQRTSKPIRRISRPFATPAPLTAKTEVDAPAAPSKWQTFEDLGLAP